MTIEERLEQIVLLLTVTGKNDVTIVEPNPSAAASDYARTLDATASRAPQAEASTADISRPT